MKLLVRALVKMISGMLLMGLVLFLPAGTLIYATINGVLLMKD